LTDEAIDFAIERQIPLVSGTTALLLNQKFKLKLLSEIKPVCHSNNFSQNLIHFTNASKLLKNKLTSFDSVIIEEHNKNKKDSPSGTAKQLSEILRIQEIHSLRGGNISGLHKIIFLGDGEEIEITHRAYEKGIFAKGALFCATMLLNKEKGFYSLNDLINE
jgi:4-hydroxy-tetrahydrodipicolinate reductase